MTLGALMCPYGYTCRTPSHDEALHKDWWDAVDRRYPDGMSWDQFQQEFTDIFFPHSHKDSKIEEFFRLEQKNMLVSEYESFPSNRRSVSLKQSSQK